MRIALALAFTAAACGSHGPHGPGSNAGDDVAPDPDAPASGGDDAAADDAPLADATPDAPADAAGPDAFPAVLDVAIDCHNTCVLHATPAMINVSAGTSFEVNWINVGDTECDVNKIDQFNHVPIIIGLEPGTSYHDPVHDWCGQLFTGTFDFEIRICTLPSYIPVNCGA